MGRTTAATRARRSATPTAGATETGRTADALFTATQQRVLALLFGQPGRAFYTKELIDLAGIGSGSVQRELARLERSRLVLRRVEGARKLYRANPESPVFQELTGIARKLLGPAEVLRHHLTSLGPQLALALVYGSIASSSDNAASDIDLLLVSDSLTLEAVYETLQAAEQQTGRKVNPTLYTTGEFQRRVAQGTPFLRKVLAGDTIVLTGSIDELAAPG